MIALSIDSHSVHSSANLFVCLIYNFSARLMPMTCLKRRKYKVTFEKAIDHWAIRKSAHWIKIRFLLDQG